MSDGYIFQGLSNLGVGIADLIKRNQEQTQRDQDQETFRQLLSNSSETYSPTGAPGPVGLQQRPASMQSLAPFLAQLISSGSPAANGMLNAFMSARKELEPKPFEASAGSSYGTYNPLNGKVDIQGTVAQKEPSLIKGTVSRDTDPNDKKIHLYQTMIHPLSGQPVSKLDLGVDATAQTPDDRIKQAMIRGASFANSRITQVYDSNRGAIIPMTVADFINKSNAEPERYYGTTGLDKTMQRNALIEDIRGNINQTRQSLGKMNEFSDVLRTQLGNALKAPNMESALSQLAQGEWLKGLSPEEQDYVQNLQQLGENAMAMRGVLGAGQGSEDLRNAIRSTIPSAVSPNKNYVTGQLDKFEGVLNRLKRGVLNVPMPGDVKKTPTNARKKVDY